MNNILKCNFKRCQTELSASAWVTSCFHIFCEEHSPAYGNDKRCPLCLSDLIGKYDLIKKHLNPPDEYRSMVLAGMNPTNILAIGSKAIAFWNFQMFQEKMIQATILRNLRSRLAQCETSYEAVTEELKTLIQQESEKCESLQKELAISTKRIKELEDKNQNKNRKLFNLHVQFQKLCQQRKLQTTLDQSVDVNIARHGSTEGRVRFSPNFVDRRDNSDDVNLLFCSQQFPTTSRPDFHQYQQSRHLQ